LLAWSDELAAGFGSSPWRALWARLALAGGCRTEGDAAWLRAEPPRGGITGPADAVPTFTLVADFYLHVPAPAWLQDRPGGAWRRRLPETGRAEEGGGESDVTPPPPPPPPPSGPVAPTGLAGSAWSLGWTAWPRRAPGAGLDGVRGGGECME